MRIIDYFDTDNREYWLSKIRECDWGPDSICMNCSRIKS